MEIEVKKIPGQQPETVCIRCHEVTDFVRDIVSFVKSRQGTLRADRDGMQYEVSVSDLFYVEAVDNRTFLYTAKNVYETRTRLYEVEASLLAKSFVRISKSSLVNLMKVKGLRPALNGRLTATLTNGEEVIISRKYVPELRKKICGGDS